MAEREEEKGGTERSRGRGVDNDHDDLWWKTSLAALV